MNYWNGFPWKELPMERLYLQPPFPLKCPDAVSQMMIQQNFLLHGTLAIKVENPEFFLNIRNVFIFEKWSLRKIRGHPMPCDLPFIIQF
jgi:hypothetical protein